MLKKIQYRYALLATALMLGLVATAAAQERFTPRHVSELRTVTSMALSPDGSQVAYTLSVPRIPFQEEDGPPWDELHLVHAAGTSRPFMTGRVNVSAVRWAPDGKAISFITRRGDDRTRGIYEIPVDGGEARRLVTHETDITNYRWSPDGRRIAFLARPARTRDVQEMQRHGFTQEIYEEALPFVKVWVTEIGGTPRAFDLPGSASLFAWSPDGARLAVALAPTALVDDDLMMRRVHVVDAVSGKVLVKIENPGKLEELAWSPDGRTLALLSGADLNDPGAGRLKVVPSEGGKLVDLLPGYEAHVRTLAWKDADTIGFVGDEGVETTFNEVRRDGTGRRTLVPAGGPILTALDLSRTGEVAAFLADTPLHPSEVFLLKGGQASTVRLTDSNPWLARLQFAKQEVVQFKARDGLALEGILIRPLDERPGQRYPLILTVHGGPEAHDRNGWRTNYANPGQLAAAEGYAVFYPNYRGSTGRGVEFSKMGQGDPAGKEFDDLVDAVDHLINTGLVDAKRVGITGGSYGGYASAWGATYFTERFAASVMFVGISNNISRVGTTDIANEEYLVHAMKRPWEDWQFFLERSPIYHAEKSRTPTLIMHGQADPRVHPAQSLEMYRYLKLHENTPVRLVWYPGEGHGNRRAASRLDYNLRMMRWMDHYLKGPGGDPPPYQLDYRRMMEPEKTEAAVQKVVMPSR
jgi:dipeptidyl aminopeptidase/acylaminoacyl peptidase